MKIGNARSTKQKAMRAGQEMGYLHDVHLAIHICDDAQEHCHDDLTVEA